MLGDNVLVIVLAGGAGERLAPLTRDRAKPAVYFGGPYRIIDFVLSNCINSGLRHIFIATQYKSLSLSRHIRQGWTVVSEELGEFIEILPPQKRVGEHWYQGTADAVYQNLYSIIRENPRYVVVLAGDHVYKMDYLKMLKFHIDAAAEVTLAAIEVPVEDGHRFGIVAVDGSDRVTGFLEKPQHPPGMPGNPGVGAGVDGHLRVRQRCSDSRARRGCGQTRQSSRLRQEHHPVGDRSTAALTRMRSTTRTRRPRNTGATSAPIDAYYEAQMDLCHVNPEFNLYDPEWPLRTYMPQAPPAKFVFAEDWRRGEAQDSLISQGCIVSGSRIHGSILCPNVRVHSFCQVEQSILMPGVRVGRHARIRKAIIDRDVDIPRGAMIGFNREEDRRRHQVSESGVVVVAPGDEPFVADIPIDALQLEAQADRRGDADHEDH